MILKKLRNNHFLSFAGNMIMAVVGMLMYSLAAHNLPTHDMGSWFFFIFNLVTLADVFRTGFLQNSLVRFYAGADEARQHNIAGSAWYIGFWITVAACILNAGAYFLFYDHAHPLSNNNVMIHWFGITFLVMLPYSVALWVLQAEERFGKILFVNAISKGLLLIFLLALIFTHRLTFLNGVYAHFIACVITSVVTLITGWDKFKVVGRRTRQSVRELFHYGKFSVGTSMGAYLLKASDSYVIKVMLPGVAGDVAIAIYSVAQQLMQAIEIIIRSFTATSMPMISAASNQGDNNKVVYVMKKFAGMITLAILPICLVCFLGADLFVKILAGNKYEGTEAVGVFRIFMLYALMLPLDRFMGITLDMINKPRLNMIKVYIMLTINVVFDVVGLLVFKNMYGVALASVLTFGTGVVFGYISLKKYLTFTMKDIFVLGIAESRELLQRFTRKNNTSARG